MRTKKFKGLDNVRPADASPDGFFQEAQGVYIDNTGRLLSCQGYADHVAGTAAHSLFGNANRLYFGYNYSLYSMLDGAAAPVVIHTFTSRPTWLSYGVVNGLVYVSNDVGEGVVVSDAVATAWGADPPEIEAVAGVGDLAMVSGSTSRYGVLATYQLSDGSESGASTPEWLTLTEGGIDLTVISSAPANATALNIYLTALNGEVFYLYGSIDTTTTSVTLSTPTGSDGRPCDTIAMIKPPTCSIIQHHRGRLYLAQDTVVWYTEPWRYHLVRPDHNLIPFSEPVTAIMPVSDGIWFATEKETVFASGQDPQLERGFSITQRVAIGVVAKTAQQFDGDTYSTLFPGAAWSALTDGSGVYVFGAGGLYRGVTGDYFHAHGSTGGLSCVRVANNLDQHIFGLKEE